MDFYKPCIYNIYNQKHITKETNLLWYLSPIMVGSQERLQGYCLYAEKNKQGQSEMQDRERLEMGSKTGSLGKKNT